jgi:hypothetical protein
VPALLFLLLRRLPLLLGEKAAVKPDEQATGEPAPLQSCLWLTAMFAFGSVFYFSSVIGQVWFTAHVTSLVACGIYLLCALPPRRPLLAGVCIGAMFLTRPQMASLGLLFVVELAREHNLMGWTDAPRQPRRVVWPLLCFLLPCALFFVAGCVHNYARFGRFMEFGHSYITTMQADNIQRFGLLNYEYLPRNLSAALCLLPKLLPHAPYVQISYHGLALWFTTPALFYVLWPEREALTSRVQNLGLALGVCIVPIALAGLLYQNDGYIQFGYRFSLDFMLPLMLILAMFRPRGVTTKGFQVLVLWGILVNLFGAITFGRMWQFYWNGFFPVS